MVLKIQILTEGSFPKDASSFCSNPSSRNTLQCQMWAVAQTKPTSSTQAGERPAENSSTSPFCTMFDCMLEKEGVVLVARVGAWKGETKCPEELQLHLPNTAFYWEKERVTSLFTSLSPLPLPQMDRCGFAGKLITDGGLKKKRGGGETSTTRLFPLQTCRWMGRPGKTGRWKTHYRCKVWRIRLRDNLRVVNFKFGGINALLSNKTQIGNKKPHENDA